MVVLRSFTQDGVALSVCSYVRSVTAEHRKRRSIIEGQACQATGISKKRFSDMTKQFRPRVQRGKNQRKLTVKPAATRKKSAFRAFYRHHFRGSFRVGTAEWKLENQRVCDLWKQQAPEDRVIFEGAAAAQGQALADALREAGESAVDTVARGLSEWDARRIRGATAMGVVKRVTEHTAWDTGLATAGPSSGLKPSLALVSEKDEVYKKSVADLFAFDQEVIPNGRGTAKPIRSCHCSKWGICRSGAYAFQASVATYNLWHALRSNVVEKCLCPLFATIAVGGNEPITFLIGDWIGKGSTILVVLLEEVAPTLFRLRHTEERLGAAEPAALPLCCSSQQLFVSVLSDAPPVEYTKVKVYNVQAHPGHAAFHGLVVQAGQQLLDTRLSVNSRAGQALRPSTAAHEATKTGLPFGLNLTPHAEATAISRSSSSLMGPGTVPVEEGASSDEAGGEDEDGDVPPRGSRGDGGSAAIIEAPGGRLLGLHEERPLEMLRLQGAWSQRRLHSHSCEYLQALLARQSRAGGEVHAHCLRATSGFS